METKRFKNTVGGIILLGAVSGFIANQFGVINFRAIFGHSHEPSHTLNGKIDQPVQTPTPPPPQQSNQFSISPISSAWIQCSKTGFTLKRGRRKRRLDQVFDFG